MRTRTPAGERTPGYYCVADKGFAQWRFRGWMPAPELNPSASGARTFVLGDTALKLLGGAPRLIASKALRRFKNLVETGEIPTTERQPAGRADTR